MAGLRDQAKGRYVAIVRHYHPQGWPVGYFAGCAKREGGSRMTDICGHQHATEGEAQACADHLAGLRNA